MDRDRALKILGLAPGAGPDAIREAYRDLAKVWHPDRFPNDERLRVKANERLSEINAAYTWLQRNASTSEPPGHDAPETPHWSPPASSATRGRSAARATPPAWIWSTGVLALLAGAGYAWFTNVRGQAPVSASTIGTSDSTAASTASPEPVDSPRRVVSRATPAHVLASATPSPDAHEAQTGDVAAPPGRGTSWFTVGSTTDEVLAVQGKPKAYDELEWSYGHSKVIFSGGRVTGWDIAPKSPLRVRLLPSRVVQPAFATFTVGSTQDEVLAIQGTPTAFNPNVWRYGASSVQFQDGRVTDWSTAPDAPLKATPQPAPPDRPWFTVGATQDEVLRVQGKPDETQELRWRYKKSWLMFSGGRVTGWDIARKSPLRVRLLPHDPGVKAVDFTFGSTPDEVLAAQGTPDAFTDASWRYGTSTVYFDDGRVARWDVRPESPLHIHH